MTETRVAVISIIVENEDAVQKVNEILHDYRTFIIGRMGIPYRVKGISIISVAIDAPQDKIIGQSPHQTGAPMKTVSYPERSGSSPASPPRRPIPM